MGLVLAVVVVVAWVERWPWRWPRSCVRHGLAHDFGYCDGIGHATCCGLCHCCVVVNRDRHSRGHGRGYCHCLGHGRGVGFGKFFCFKQSGAVVIKCWLRGSGIGLRSTIVSFAYAWLFFRVLFRSALALS